MVQLDEMERQSLLTRRADVVRTNLIVWAALLLGAALLLRIVSITADAPGYLDTTGFLVTDEGWYAGDAARQVLGIPHPAGDLNTVTHTPLFHLWSQVAFWLFGVGIHSLRLLNVAAGVLTVGAVATAAPRTRWAGYLAAVLLSLDYTHVMFSRIGGTEPLMTLLAVLALLAFVQAERHRWLHMVGVLLAAAVGLTKANGFIFLPIYLFAEALRLYGERTSWPKLIGDGVRALVLPTLTAFGALAAWWWLWVQPNFAEWQIFNAHTVTSRMPESLGQLGRNVAAFLLINPLSQHSFLLLVLGLCGLTLALGRLYRREEVPRYAIFSASWVLGLTGMLMPYNYQAERYFLLYIPALALLTGYLVHALSEQYGRRIPVGFLAAGTVWVMLSQAFQLRLAWAVVVTGLLLLAVWALWRFQERPRAALAGLVVVAAVALAVPYGQWTADLRYSVPEVAAAVGQQVRADTNSPCILGNAAGTLALENHLPTITSTYGDMQAKWAACRPTHLLVSAREYHKLMQQLPGLEQHLEYRELHFIYVDYQNEPWPGEKLFRIREGFQP